MKDQVKESIQILWEEYRAYLLSNGMYIDEHLDANHFIYWILTGKIK